MQKKMQATRLETQQEMRQFRTMLLEMQQNMTALQQETQLQVQIAREDRQEMQLMQKEAQQKFGENIQAVQSITGNACRALPSGDAGRVASFKGEAGGVVRIPEQGEIRSQSLVKLSFIPNQRQVLSPNSNAAERTAQIFATHNRSN